MSDEGEAVGDSLPAVKCEGEWLAWVAVEREMPDSEITVMLFVPGSDEEVWPGYWDGEAWIWADGVPVEGEVVCWGDMPKGWG